MTSQASQRKIAEAIEDAQSGDDIIIGRTLDEAMMMLAEYDEAQRTADDDEE